MKKKLTALALVIVMVAMLFTGLTMAYFTDTDEATNTFTVGNVKIKLDEAEVEYDSATSKWNEKNPEVRTENGITYEGKAYPGAELPKDPTVHNEGDNGAWVRVKVNFDYAWMTFFMDNLEGRNRYDSFEDYVQTYIGTTYGDGWSLESVEEGLPVGEVSGANNCLIATFKYNEVLAPNTSTEPVFEKITIPAEFDNEDLAWLNNVDAGNGILEKGMMITVIAEAIQADGFDTWEEAFVEFDAQ